MRYLCFAQFAGPPSLSITIWTKNKWKGCFPVREYDQYNHISREIAFFHSIIGENGHISNGGCPNLRAHCYTLAELLPWVVRVSLCINHLTVTLHPWKIYVPQDTVWCNCIQLPWQKQRKEQETNLRSIGDTESSKKRGIITKHGLPRVSDSKCATLVEKVEEGRRNEVTACLRPTGSSKESFLFCDTWK